MVLRRLKSLAPACALALSSQLLLGATSFSDNFTARILSAHNRERLALGVPALILVWLLLAVIGGLVGVLLGWLPGLVALMLARALWLPGLLLLAGLAVTHL